jgi:hypothetical protein
MMIENDFLEYLLKKKIMKNLIEQIHKVKIYGNNKKYYRKNGINCKYGDIIEIKSSELNPDSNEIVSCICEECKKEVNVPFKQYMRCKKGFVCSSKCRMIRTRRVFVEKYGVDNISKLDFVKNKKKNKAHEKYGVDNISQSNIIKNKKINTSIERFGVDNISKSITVKNKKIATSRKHYGVDYPFQSKEIHDEYIKKIQKKYGNNITNISQVSEIMDKKYITGICGKDYTLPSGRKVRIQGYENYGIEYLLNQGIDEKDIIVGNKQIEKETGLIMFNDVQKNKYRRYFPDIFVKSINKIYEVKSTYTMKLNVDLINMKRQAVLKRGFDFEFLVFNEKGVKS